MTIRACGMVVGMALVLAGVLAGGANAALVVEAEADGTAVNNSVGTAQAIPSAAFTTPPPANVFGALPTATITGRNGGSDVDFFSFQANPGIVYFDIDNDPFSLTQSWRFSTVRERSWPWTTIVFPEILGLTLVATRSWAFTR